MSIRHSNTHSLLANKNLSRCSISDEEGNCEAVCQLLETEGLMSKISGSVSSNAVTWPGDKRGSSSFLDRELKNQDHNFSVTALQKL